MLTTTGCMAAGPGGRTGMDKARFILELGRQRAYCEGRSRLYHAVLLALEEDAARAPQWLARVEDVWRDRRFVVGWEAVHLLLANMHLWALRGQAPELAAVYPSCGGAGGRPGDAAVRFLRRASSPFWNWLGSSRLQTNEAGRGVAWTLAAAAAFVPRGLPFHLVEMGASAGLALIGDALPSSCHFSGRAELPAGWDRSPYPVLSRVGLDMFPRRLARPLDRLWLKACVWADDAARLRRLDQATGLFLDLHLRRSGPRLKRRRFHETPEWLVEHRRPAPGEGLLVFNASATVFLDDEAYSRLRRGMERALAPWADRALWVECELPRGGRGPHELTAHRLVGGRLESRCLALMDPRPREVRLLEGWDFLRP